MEVLFHHHQRDAVFAPGASTLITLVRTSSVRSNLSVDEALRRYVADYFDAYRSPSAVAESSCVAGGAGSRHEKNRQASC